MIAYTAIYGGYDLPKPHPDHSAVTDWIAYTDNPDLAAPGWDVRHAPLRYEHPRLAAKWWKCHPPEADASLWLDGSVILTGPDYIDVIVAGLEKADMTMFVHPARDCIYDEVGASTPMLKYVGLPLQAQVEVYARQGWPAHNGLWATTTFGRRHTTRVLAMSAAWFAHNELLTYQDQLSLPPLLEDYGIAPQPIPGNLWRNPWFKLSGHESEA